MDDSPLSHRLLLTLGFDGTLAGFSTSGGRERYHFRGATLGVGYRHWFRRTLGLHALVAASLGGTRVSAVSADSFRIRRGAARTGRGYATGVELGPLFGPWGGFYILPMFHARVLLGEPANADLTLRAQDRPSVARSVHFDPPLPLTGARLQLGGMFGEHDRFEVGGGFEAGKAYGGPRRYFSLALRVGVSVP